ncbi:hypothetical protein BP6252_05274 [Coleophoma cylindrospora]|uniref:Pre-mRNA-splicing factor 38B n=1 Tax=Coleophoma cylindrospora TaxID=1849047 RepID=A0A3D8RTU3_9HELO|nr:hypothetical protein BP6252_05274 [Coleophoma cylindrospora]
MAKDEVLTDEYVAQLLTKDAKASSIKYSALGLEAFAPSKPPANKPKPNTRFLRNIIKDTDSHNAALLAKEAADAKARLESLTGNDRRPSKSSHVAGGDIRRRQLGDIAAILGGRPAKRKRPEEGRALERSERHNSSDEHDSRRKVHEEKSRRIRHRDEEDADEDRSRSHRSHRRTHRNGSKERDTRSRGHQKRDLSRSRSPRAEHDVGSRRRERSPRRRRSNSRDNNEPRKEKSRRSHRRSPSIERYLPRRRHEELESKKKSEPTTDYDSDPLDAIIGPRPAPVQQVRTRGRGTVSQASGIDSRFSANYDPTQDVQLDPEEENDWDQALEALRDRQKWKQQGADRLRAAGFTEEEIGKWEKGGEKREEDVKWSKAGEGREWDRGKVFDDDGGITHAPEWGRLKGT